MRYVDLEVVGAEGVDQIGFHVRAALAEAAISPIAFAAVEFRRAAMHSDEEHIEIFQ